MRLAAAKATKTGALLCCTNAEKNKVPALEGFGLYMEERQSIKMKADKVAEDWQNLQICICTCVLI